MLKQECVIQGIMQVHGVDAKSARFVPYIGDGSAQGLAGQWWSIDLPRALFSEAAQMEFARGQGVSVAITIRETESSALSAERWLARKGFADSRAHSSVEIAKLMQEYINELRPYFNGEGKC